MISPDLNPKLFDEDVEQVPIRQGFGEGLLVAGRHDERIVALCADLTDSSKVSLFKEEFPDRFFEIGIGEQNMASVASGMAAMGKIPFIASYAMFSPGRNWEQIRTTIAYNNQPVKIAGSHAGVSVGPDGGTHQAIEDIALMRIIPRMVVISPCDSIEAKKATILAATTNDPVYIRLAREKTPVITTIDSQFEIGKARIVYESKSKPLVTLFATGALLFNTLVAARDLELKGVYTMVVHVATIKPLDKEMVISSVAKTGKVITVEEHQVAGGFGSAIGECIVEHTDDIGPEVMKNFRMKMIGVRDVFGQSGTPGQLIEHYGMGVADIKKAVEKILQ